MKPIIGIVSKPLSEFEYPDTIWTEDYVKDEFRDIVCRSGGIPIGILPPFHSKKFNADESPVVYQNNLTEEEKSDLEMILGRCDGFILQGGLSADYYEIYIAQYAVRNNIPIFGVCAGFNTLARVAGCEVATGKSLGITDNLHNVYCKEFRHTINLIKGGTLFEIFNVETMEVNSLHTYFLPLNIADKRLEKINIDATVSSAMDNNCECITIEAFTIKETKCAIGVKWHPEIMDDDHKLKLFRMFIAQCL